MSTKYVPKDEQETTINIFLTETIAKVYTSDYTMRTKMDNLCKKNPESYRLVKSDNYGAMYEFPKDYISFRTKKTKRTMTDEQREKLSNRMRDFRSKTKN